MMTMRNRVWPLCLAAFLFLAAVQAAFFPLGQRRKQRRWQKQRCCLPMRKAHPLTESC